MSKDEPSLDDISRQELLKLYDDIAAIVDKFLDGQPGDMKFALAVSALVHKTAQTVGDTACCPFHALELWARVGHNVMVEMQQGGEENEDEFNDHDTPLSLEEFTMARRPRTKLH